MLIKKNKTVTYYLVNAYITSSRDTIIVKSDSDIREIKNSEIPIMDLLSNGSSITKGYVDKYDLKYNLVKIMKKDDNNKNTLEEPAMKQVSFSEFAKDFKL